MASATAPVTATATATAAATAATTITPTNTLCISWDGFMGVSNTFGGSHMPVGFTCHERDIS